MIRDNPAMAETVLSAARDAGTPHVIDISSAVVFRPHPMDRMLVRSASMLSYTGTRAAAMGRRYLQSKVLAEEVVGRHRAKGAAVSSIHHR
jgi:hypothetical protein